MTDDLLKAWSAWLPTARERKLRANAGPIVPVLETAFASPDLRAVPDEGSVAVRNGQGVRIRFEGSLVRRSDDVEVGIVHREFDTRFGEARHDEWRIAAELQGQGRARFALKSTIALYRQIGVNTVYVNASEVGRYVWASSGFDFLEPSMRDRVLESVRPMARNLGFELRDDTLPHAWSLAILGRMY